MLLPFIDRNPTLGELQKIRLLLSTYQDGTGMLADKKVVGRTLPGWRDFERVVALALGGNAQESKAIFDVIFPDQTNPKVSYGISCKMRNTLDRIDKDGRVTLELSNSAGMFWKELRLMGITQEIYRTRPQEVGPAVIKLYEKWHKEARTDSEGKFILQKGKYSESALRNGGIIELAKSFFQQLRHSLVREFLGIHNMFRNYIKEMLRYMDELVAGQPAMAKPEITARYQALSEAAYQYTQLLHFHHNGESSMLFPALRKEGLEAAIIERLEADHEEIAGLITRLNSHMANVAAMDARLVDVDMRRLAEGLRAHLAYEESHICPLLTHFTRWPL